MSKGIVCDAFAQGKSVVVLISIGTKIGLSVTFWLFEPCKNDSKSNTCSKILVFKISVFEEIVCLVVMKHSRSGCESLLKVVGWKLYRVLVPLF